MVIHSYDIASAMNEVARTVDRSRGSDAVLTALVAGAVESFPEITHAGISRVHRGGRIETVAASHDLVRQLFDLQEQAQQGPSLDVVLDQPVILMERARHEQRWPRYLPEAVQRGLRSQVELRLLDDRRTVGTLTLFSTSSDTIGQDTVTLAEVFASYVTAALGLARNREDMVSAMATRQLIGQATGIAMERFGLGEAEAFTFLLRLSSTSNVKLRDVARGIVDGHPVTTETTQI